MPFVTCQLPVVSEVPGSVVVVGLGFSVSDSCESSDFPLELVFVVLVLVDRVSFVLVVVVVCAFDVVVVGLDVVVVVKVVVSEASLVCLSVDVVVVVDFVVVVVDFVVVVVVGLRLV